MTSRNGPSPLLQAQNHLLLALNCCSTFQMFQNHIKWIAQLAALQFVKMQSITIQEYDMRDTIKTERKLLRFTGFYPSQNEKFRPLHACLKYVCLILIYAQFLTMVVYIWINKNDVSKLAETLQIFMTELTCISKVANFSSKKQKLLAIEDILAQPEMYGFPQDCLGLLKDKLKSCINVVRVFRFLAVTAVTFNSFFPYLDESKSLPMPGWFPYDYKEYYHQTVFFQFFTLVASAYNNSTIDCLMWILTTVAAGQFAILMENLKNLHYSFDNTNELEKQLIACIEHHKKIVLLVRSIEDTFSNGIFVQFFSSIIIICMTGFQMTVVPIPSAQFLFIVVYFSSMMWQVGMYCYYGHDIMTTSNEIGEFFYMSNWYESDVRIRKIMLIFLERIKVPVVLTCGKLVPLSLVTFTTILRSAYSYFAVMQRLYRGE